MWRQTEGPKVTKVTKTLATTWSEMKPCPHDRPLRQARVDSHRQSVREGTFRTCEWAWVKCLATQETYRINGKHTSHAFVAEWDTISKKPVSVIISGFEADTLEDVAKLYCTFDSKTAARTANDVYRIYAAAHPELADLPSRTVNLGISGLAYNLWMDNVASHTPEDRAELAIQHHQFIVWLQTMLGVTDNKCIRRGPTVAAMARTWFKSPEDSAEFWSKVRDASGPDRATPDRILNKYLERHAVRSGMGAQSAKDQVHPREMFIKCLHAWNAWRRNESTALRYNPNNPVPSVA